MHIYPYRREVWVVVLGDKYYIVDNKDPVIRAFDATGKLVHELQPHVPLEPEKDHLRGPGFHSRNGGHRR